MDHADIAGEHDFSTEKLMERRGMTAPAVKRGRCLYCTEELQPLDDGQFPLYCDADCRAGHEHEQGIKARQRRY